MSTKIIHPFHLVEESPWPLLRSNFALGLTRGISKWIHKKRILSMIISLLMLCFTAFIWWRDISRESAFQGFHTKIVEEGLRLGIILFITSEVFFFVSFFWASFHSSLAPNIEIGSKWPPRGIMVFRPWGVPLLNTIILLSSGIRVTWAHKRFDCRFHDQRILSLIITTFLGAYFTGLQAIEYLEATFSIADSIYGSTFYIATGFHGIHVIVGTIFLIISCIRLNLGHLSTNHHFGLIASIWYWHFVDIVWLFLYGWIYGWGSFRLEG